MSNHEIQSASEIIKKLCDLNLPRELQQRIYDTANGMVIAADIFQKEKEQASLTDRTA